MKATVADLFDAICRVRHRERDVCAESVSLTEMTRDGKELFRADLVLRRVLEECHHEVELAENDYSAVEQFFSKIPPVIKMGGKCRICERDFTQINPHSGGGVCKECWEKSH